MQRTVESVEQYGVLSPLIARPRPEGGYEIISGHRRNTPQSLQIWTPCLSLCEIWRMMPPRY